MAKASSLWIATLVVGLCGCAVPPADVAGTYTVALTNGANGCNISGWQSGPQSNPVSFVITQSGATITGNAEGLGAVALTLLLGTSSFSGAVTGNNLDLVANGTTPYTSNGCTYTYRAQIVGSSSGNAISGQIRYTTATNGSASCGTITSCVSTQDFSGSRPPR